MEQLSLPLFILNFILILVDASVGYHLAPLIMETVDDPDSARKGVITTRRLLPLVVALYMFFNCMGYFQGQLSYLLTVSGLIACDLGLQFYLLHRKRTAGDEADDEEY